MRNVGRRRDGTPLYAVRTWGTENMFVRATSYEHSAPDCRQAAGGIRKVEPKRPGPRNHGRAGASGPKSIRVSTRFDEMKKQWLDTVAELKKVTWPDKETTKNLTLVVIGISAALGVLLGGLNWDSWQQLFALI